MSEYEGRRHSRAVGHRELFAACLIAFTSSAAATAPAAPASAAWQPSPGHVQVAIWPGAPPDLAPDPLPESGASTHVSRPTMTVYAPKGRNMITGKPFGPLEDAYVKRGRDRIGGTYMKSLYRQYTDARRARTGRR